MQTISFVFKASCLGKVPSGVIIYSTWLFSTQISPDFLSLWTLHSCVFQPLPLPQPADAVGPKQRGHQNCTVQMARTQGWEDWWVNLRVGSGPPEPNPDPTKSTQTCASWWLVLQKKINGCLVKWFFLSFFFISVYYQKHFCLSEMKALTKERSKVFR